MAAKKKAAKKKRPVRAPKPAASAAVTTVEHADGTRITISPRGHSSSLYRG